MQPAADPRGALGQRPAPLAHRAVLGGLVAACAGVLLAFLAGLLLPSAGAGVSATTSASSSTSPTAAALSLPGASAPAGAVRLTQPRAVTLQLSDLPSGTRVTSEGSASFRSGMAGTPPPSWEVLLQLDGTQSQDYRYVESLAVVYPSNRVAAAAMSSMESEERSAGASEKAPTIPLAARETIWQEQSPNQPGEVIVRVTWQSMNVVGQVSLFGKAGQAAVERAQQLALVEQGRIADPVAYRDAS